MARDLNGTAKDMLGEMIYGADTLDIDALREGVSDRAHEGAETAVIYTATAIQIIQDYERESYVPNESDMGTAFRSDQWQEAATAWAYEVARAVIEHEAEEILQHVEERADELADVISGQDAARGLFDEDGEAIEVRPEDLRVSLQCPHGWAAHDFEEEGACFWVSRQLDGCNAIAEDVGPFWISYTWTPHKPAAE